MSTVGNKSDKPASVSVNKKRLTAMIAQRHINIPNDVVVASVNVLVRTLKEAMAEGRPVSLRGFGRLIPRRYDGPSLKRVGLLFHPSDQLIDQVNLIPPK
ncbi:MAG: HU family DNA-binding protein [Deltaproteobacteria bacterium]|nr:HU family DNA-binding protein [Deltaproteobacteria bacterium]